MSQSGEVLKRTPLRRCWPLTMAILVFMIVCCVYRSAAFTPPEGYDGNQICGLFADNFTTIRDSDGNLLQYFVSTGAEQTTDSGQSHAYILAAANTTSPYTQLISGEQHQHISYELSELELMGKVNIAASMAMPMTQGKYVFTKFVNDALFMLANCALIAIDITTEAPPSDWQPMVVLAGALGVKGNAEGSAMAARFGQSGYVAHGIQSKDVGFLFISDTENHCVRHFDLETKVLKTIVGQCGASGNDRGTYNPWAPGLLHSPGTLGYISTTNTFNSHLLYISDNGNDQLLQVGVGRVLEPGANISDLPALFSYSSVVVNVMNAFSRENLGSDAVPTKSRDLVVLKGVIFPEFLSSTTLETFNQNPILVFFTPGIDCGVIIALPEPNFNGTLLIAPMPFPTSDKVPLPRGVCSGGDPVGILRLGTALIGVTAKPEVSIQQQPYTPLIGFGTSSCEGLGQTSAPPSQPPPSPPTSSNDNLTLTIVIVVVAVVVVVVAIVAAYFVKTAPKIHPTEDDGESAMVTVDPPRKFADDETPSQVTASDGNHTAATSRDKLSSIPNLPEDETERKKKLCTEGRFQRNKLLGRGANGSVYSCVLLDGSTVAMKEVLLPSNAADLLTEIQKEVDIVSDLHHPHVVEYYGCRNDAEDMKLLLFMEIVSAGSVASMVRNVQEPLAVEAAQIYARQMVEAVAYIHGKGVVHRDIKCDNVLLTSEGVCKLADFGASKVVGNAAGASRAANTMIGTPFFMAPEILMGAIMDSDDDEEGETGYGKKADIWSLGITILELMNRGNPPWPDFPNQGAAFMHIASEEGVPVIPDHVNEHAEVVDFIEKCCVRDPRQRWTANELLQHDWIVGDMN